MNADRLLTIYDRIAEAPDAIARLRCFVLDLAVRGKLVEQDPEDEPASELLKRIVAEKARLVKAGKIKKPRELTNGRPHTEIFEIPSSWRWCTLNTIGAIVGGGTPSTTDTENFTKAGNGIPWLTPADLGRNSNQYVERGVRDLSTKGLKSSSATLMPVGTVLFTSRAPIGYVAIAANPISTNQGFKSIVPYVQECSRFIALAMRAFGPTINVNASGTTFKEVSGKIIACISFPLPPLAEQHRIVAKVDELMNLCDKLEKARTNREDARDRLTKASLARLSTPDTDRKVFRTHAQLAINILPKLTVRADQIKQLRQTILNLAARGKLVEQDPEDEPASELLKRIAAEKVRLSKVGQIRKPRSITPLDSADIPYPLPIGWQWTQIAQFGVINPRNEAPDDYESSFVPMPFIAAEYGATHGHKSQPWGEIKKGYTHFAEGDVGLAKITPCFENGKSTVFRNLTGGFGSGTTELHVVRPIFINPDYVVIYLKCPHFIETGIPRMTGTAGQKRVPAEHFTSSPFPLPPLAEQHRIVAKVDEMMALCDQLEASLCAINTNHRRLLESVLHEALSPSFQQWGLRDDIQFEPQRW